MNEVDSIIKTVQNFFDFLSAVQLAYNCASNVISLEDKRAVDYLHMIEFEKRHEEMGKICTKLHDSRVTRRESKDILDILYPLIEWMSRPEHKNAMNDLRIALDHMKKIDRRHANRHYNYRIIDKEG